jgi:membrane protein
MGRPEVVINLLARLVAVKLVRDRMKATKGQPPRPVAPRPAASARKPAPKGATYDESAVPPQRAGGSGPDTPLELEAPDWKATGKRTLKEVKADRVPLIAAGMAYYLFLAIFPAVIAFTGILGLMEIDTQPIIKTVEENLPGESGALLVQAIEGSQKTSDSTALGATLIGIALALWSASSGFVALQKGLNVAYDVPEDRKFIGARAVALALVVATGLLGGVPSPIFIFGDSTLLLVLGWILTAVAVTILFSVFYYLGPNRGKPTWQWVSAGGFVGAFIWIASSVGFGLYAGDPGRYAKTYGSTGAVIALLFWLFLTSIAILIGGELNAELERQAEKRKSRSSK